MSLKSAKDPLDKSGKSIPVIEDDPYIEDPPKGCWHHFTRCLCSKYSVVDPRYNPINSIKYNPIKEIEFEGRLNYGTDFPVPNSIFLKIIKVIVKTIFKGVHYYFSKRPINSVVPQLV